MKLPIKTLTVERFRAIKHLKIEGLGRVNLITGRNNTGKSSLLEALQILASNGSLSVMRSILSYREEDLGETDEPSRLIDADGVFLFSSLFNGFPQFSSKLNSIVITSSGSLQPMQIVMKADWLSEERAADGTRKLVPKQEDLFGEGETIPVISIEAEGKHRIFSLDYIRRINYRIRPIRRDDNDEPSLPCVYVSPYGGEDTSKLGILWDKIALSSSETDVVTALKIIDPRISAVSMIGGEGPRRQRIAIVRADNLPRPVPLRSFGDGVNRLFGIVLSLVNAKGGLLLIDEIENGIHHSVQIDVWRAIFKLARRLDIQVFATSHSWDSITAFQKASAETPEEGALVRLSRKDEEIVATVFSKDELAIVTRERIEVR